MLCHTQANEKCWLAIDTTAEDFVYQRAWKWFGRKTEC